MGIVIINGKRYDSVTGLMITDHKNDKNTQPVVVKHQVEVQPETKADKASDDSTPDWIASYVDEVSHNHQVAQKSVASEANDAAKAAKAVADAVTQVSAATTTAVNVSRSVAHNIRRSVGVSHTLNRRFVRKPLSENGEYAESLAVRHLQKTARQAQQAGVIKTQPKVDSATAPIHIPEETQLDAAAEANQDFIPMLTKRQAESLNRIAKRRTAPVGGTNTTSTNDSRIREPIRLARTTPEPETSSDDVFNERLSRLSEILRNAQELDEQQVQQPSRRANAASRKQSTASQAKRQAKKRRFHFPAIMTTAAAMASIAAIGVYVAMPSISIKVAANRAGIDAKTPYTPAGFTIDGKVAYQDGRITINYRNKSGADGYSVTQEVNNTDTDASLEQSISDQSNNAYQVIQNGDQTLYRYRDMVTWLDNGMQYTINTNDYLNSDDISDIASSL